MASDSKLVVYAALAGNGAVAATKYFAAAISGSSAMLTEAVHSSVDTFNQCMLLIGDRRSQKPADAEHPFGYGGESYFWAFVVAILVLIAGGVVSIVQGLQQLRHPEPIESLPLSLTVLGLSALFEAGSLLVGYRESRRMVARHPGDGRYVSLWKYIKVSKDPNLYETLLEDSAALIGIAIATVGVLGNALARLLWMDGVASIAIGLLLIANSYLIIGATRSLIAGEAAAPALRKEMTDALAKSGFAGISTAIRTLHLGPEAILVAVTLKSAGSTVGPSRDDLERIKRCLRELDERIKHVFFEFPS